MGEPRRERVIWAIGAACPSRCLYCGIASQRDKQELDRSNALRAAHGIVAAGFREVVFVGGEPLLYAHLGEVLDVLAGRVEIAIFSGGLPGDPERHLRLLARATRLVLSIDVADEDRNDLVRGRRGVTREVWTLATAVRSALPRLDLSVSSVISRSSAPLFASSWERVAELRPTAWVAVLAGDNFRPCPSEHFLDRAALERLYFEDAPALARRIGRERPDTDFMLFPVPLPLLGLGCEQWAEARGRRDVGEELERFSRGEYNASFVERYGCPLLGRDISIGVGGEVHPCSQAPILGSEHVLGRLVAEPLSAALEPRRLARFAQAVPHAPCRRCWAPSNAPPEVLQRLLGARAPRSDRTAPGGAP